MLSRAPCCVVAFLVSFALSVGCGASADPTTQRGTAPTWRDNSTPSVEAVADADPAVLFLGNSHTGMHDVPGLVMGLLQAADPEREVVVHFAAGGFLNDLDNEHVHELIASREWDYVVLQGQEISRSGLYYYSTDEAVKLANAADAGGAKVLLFVEWARRGEDETERFEAVYRGIAAMSPSTVVPIGQAFDRALAERPDIVLHADDGNHSSAAGAYLAASMLYSTITDENPAEISQAGDEAKYTGDTSVSAEERQFLREISAQTWEAIEMRNSGHARN